MPRMTEDQRMTLLNLIKDKKDILFGEFAPTLTWQKKKDTWDEIASTAKALGLCNKTGEFIRDTTWQNWRKRSLVT